MLVRFTLLSTDTQSGRKTGILVAAHDLCDDGDLSVEEHRNLRSQLGWFNEQLKVPQILSGDEHYRALSWFKPGAIEPISKAWMIKAILEENGFHIQVHKTTDPGIIIYEDDWQVVAKPRKRQSLS